MKTYVLCYYYLCAIVKMVNLRYIESLPPQCPHYQTVVLVMHISPFLLKLGSNFIFSAYDNLQSKHLTPVKLNLVSQIFYIINEDNFQSLPQALEDRVALYHVAIKIFL